MIRHLVARWLPPRGRHRERRTEPVSPVTVAWHHGADPGAAPLTVLLPAVLDQGPRPEPALHLPPTPHAGATEGWSPLREIGPDDGGSLDPETAAWDKEFAELDRRLADVHMAFVRRWAAEVEPLAEQVAPGWRSLPPVEVRNFEEAMTLAGVHVMPAVPVDWSTAEYAAVGMSA